MTEIASFFFRFLFLLPAIICHEVAHGYAAYLLGDPTARNAGRLTLWPHKHIDPFGTILLPVLLLLGNSRVVFGYAKPVPVNPRYFEDHRMGMLITGVSGPAANLALAAGAGLLFRMLPPATGVRFLGEITTFQDGILYFVYLNLLLLFFNLIPLPGLDGSRVVQRFLSPEALRTYLHLERYTILILFGFLFFFPQVVNAYFRFTVDPLLTLFTGLQFG